MSRSSTLTEISKDGVALLEDLSMWRIASGHLGRVVEWAPGMEILIEKSDNAMWQYTLVRADSDKKKKVSVTPASGTFKFVN